MTDMYVGAHSLLGSWGILLRKSKKPYYADSIYLHARLHNYIT